MRTEHEGSEMATYQMTHDDTDPDAGLTITAGSLVVDAQTVEV